MAFSSLLAWRKGFNALVGTLNGLVLLATPLRAAEDVSLSAGVAKEALNSKRLVLRYTDQPVYCQVENNGGAQINATVALMLGEKLLAESAAVKVAPAQQVPVTFAPVDKEPPGAPGPLAGLRLSLRISGKEAATLPVDFLAPSEYLDVTPEIKSENNRPRLTVRVQSNGKLSGPPCKVRLNLPKGLRTTTKNLEGSVTADGALTLTADFAPPRREETDLKGFSLSVDSVERAFVYKTNFAPGEAPHPLGGWELSLEAPSYLRSSQPFDPVVRLDLPSAGAPPLGDVTLKFGLDAAMDNNFSFTTHTGARDESVIVWPKADALHINASTHDWSPSIGLGGIQGKHALLVQAFSGKNSEPTVELKDRWVAVDDSPPMNLEFIKPPALVPSNQTEYRFAAKGEDPESDIKSVRFFWGHPVKDPNGVLSEPKDIVPVEAAPDNPERTVWHADVSLPQADGRHPLTVEFTNHVDLSTFVTKPFLIAPPTSATPAAGPTTGTVRVTVTEDKRTQPAVKVQLADEKAAIKSEKTKSDDGDDYVFKDVPPGKYTVVANNTGSGRGGTASIEVKAGQETKAKVELTLK